jgi:hypothetical protein
MLIRLLIQRGSILKAKLRIAKRLSKARAMIITIRAIKFILQKRIRGQIRRLNNKKSLIKWRVKE